MLKQILILAAPVMVATPGSASSQQSPPASEKAKQVEAIVDKAATLIDKNGKAALAEFRKPDSEWFRGTTYLFAYDLKGNVLLNPALPAREGTNVAGQKDAKGSCSTVRLSGPPNSRGRDGSTTCFPSRDRPSFRRNGPTSGR